MNRRSFLSALVSGSVAVVGAVLASAPRQVSGGSTTWAGDRHYSIGIDHGTDGFCSTILMEFDGSVWRVVSSSTSSIALGAP